MSSSGYRISGLVVEESRSRSKKHLIRRLVLILKKDGRVIDVEKHREVIAGEKEAKPTYARGWAKNIDVLLEHGDYVIQAVFIKNFLGKVKGVIEVYNYRGELVYRAVYRDGELRRSIGDPVYAWIIRLVAERLRIPVKKTRLGDEKKR